MVDWKKHRKLFLFDLDGTLIEGHVTRDGDSGPFEEVHPFLEVHLLPGRVEALAELLDNGARIGICTNKAGVAFGHHTVQDCRTKARRCTRELGLDEAGKQGRVSWTECYDHPHGKIEAYRKNSFYRKPAPGMLLKSLVFHEVEPASAVFIGDMEVDEQAAARAGVGFVPVDDFFN